MARYAYDIIILATNEDVLQNMLDNLVKIEKHYETKVGIEKVNEDIRGKNV